MNYLLKQATKKKSPQSEPIPGLENSMVENSAGGYVFSADAWTRLERFLILGTEGGSYYCGERDLTKENVDNLRDCLVADGWRTVHTIVEISKSGRAPKNDAALYALAVAASCGDHNKTEALALGALPMVARTGRHLFQFVAYVSSMRGWGTALRRAIGDWYTSKPTDKLAHQLAKYQSREGWTHRDVLLKAHVRGENSELLRWVTDTGFAARNVSGKGTKKDRQYPEPTGTLPEIVVAMNSAKVASVDEVCRLIRGSGLTREMVPTELQRDPRIWEALMEKMPIGAMVRTLGRMGSVGLLTPLSNAEDEVCRRFANGDLIQKARLHPIAILTALLTYKNGKGTKGKLSWQVCPRVVDALNLAFYSAFRFVEPTNKRFYLGIDVSGSMTSGEVAGVPGLTPNVGAAAMAMLIARTEPHHFIGGFSTRFVDLGISASDRLDSAMEKCHQNFGGTDCAVAIKHAYDCKYPVDAFVVITDGETWAGDVHAQQTIEQYRKATGINAKLITVNMVSNVTRLTDPKDLGSLDVVGFDAAVPTIINQFLGVNAAATEEEDNNSSGRGSASKFLRALADSKLHR